jgi:hypothetical protein
MNVLFISHIYKPATCSHSKPRLFETTTLTLLLTNSRIPLFIKSSRAMTLDPDLQEISESPSLPKFATSQVRDSRPSRVHDFEASQVQDSRSSRVRDFEALQVQDSKPSRVRDFEASQVQDSRPSRVRDFEASQVQDSRSSRVRDFEAPQVQDSRPSRMLCS